MLECAAGGFEGSFAVTRDDTMRIQVTDSTGLRSDMALAYPVRMLEDTPPAIDILSPDDGGQLPRSMEIQLSYRAYDDFGISSVRLYHMKEGRDRGYRMTSLLTAAGGARKSVEDSWSWSLSGENVFPGDRILYYLEAADNREQGGPNRTKTQVRVLVVPSLADIYAEARKDESDVGEKAESIIEDSKEVRDRLRQLADDFRSEGKMDWEKKSEGQKIASIQ